MRRGFTIVELVITVAIMGILLTLAVVNLINTQVGARDNQRKADIDSIALALENYYNNSDSLAGGVSGISYPATDIFASNATFKAAFPDIDPKAVRGPGVDNSSPMSLGPATNNVQTVTGVTNLPALSDNQASQIYQYVYQPIKADGSLCASATESSSCRKFNLYYRLEADNTVYMVTSKHQ